MLNDFFQKHSKTSVEELIILGESALAEWQLVKLVEKLTYSGGLKSLRLCRGSAIVEKCKGVSEDEVNQLELK